MPVRLADCIVAHVRRNVRRHGVDQDPREAAIGSPGNSKPLRGATRGAAQFFWCNNDWQLAQARNQA